MHMHCEAFEEKSMKTCALLEQFIFFLKDTEHFPLIIDLVDDTDENLKPWCSMLFQMCKKFDFIGTAYNLGAMPMGVSGPMRNLRESLVYWLNCAIGKGEFILQKIKTGHLNRIHFHHNLTFLLTKINGKLKRLFNRSVWN